MTFVEQRTISRKTPIDAMLEISAEAAQRLAALGAYFTVICNVIIDGLEGSARLRSMSCTCEKGAGSAHEHQFIEAELLRLLEPGTEVRIAIDDARSRTVRLDRA
jgi:hypothetical protein